MESMAYRSQQRQANKINDTRINDPTYKQQLDVGDIGVVYVNLDRKLLNFWEQKKFTPLGPSREVCVLP